VVSVVPWFVWIAVGIILFIAEVFTAGFLLACFGAGFIASGIVSMLGFGLASQIVTFVAATVALSVFLRPIMLRHFHKSRSARTNVDALIGKSGRVSEKIDPACEKGRVAVRGEDWRASSAEGIVIEAGEKVVVIQVDGTRLIVRKSDA
jgi:membrane protein implicated in regulation of membrane protease activity